MRGLSIKTVFDRITLMKRIFARKTSLREIDIDLALSFVSENHRQGVAAPGKNTKSFGLLLESELVAVAIFCNPRTAGMQKRYTAELLRMAFKKDARVVGGASKLIKGFLETEPWDLFTYQDTFGEVTDVYEKAGMTLVSEARPKKILVKNGLTRATAENNHDDWFSVEQVVSRGPDALLGTKLGEVFREDGSRKSNIDLFLENGYHLEEVPGDRVYEWRNPNVSFYTYRVTSIEDNGYYIGRHVVQKQNPTIEDCLNDGYMGSGGKKYQAWVSRVGKDSLQKEILGIYGSWSQVIKAEKKFIGDSHLTDPDCKNFQPGGTGMTRIAVSYLMKSCSTHGLSMHQGDRCVTCENLSRIQMKECSIHGEVKHRGNVCYKCMSESSLSMKECQFHGMGLHQGDSCATCVAEKAIRQDVCDRHERTLFQGSNCLKCSAEKRDSLQYCMKHGEETSHRGNKCVKCFNEGSYSIRGCEIHGETKFKGDVCAKCFNAKSLFEKDCKTHGVTKFRGDSCLKCVNENRKKEQECETHGLTVFLGNTCAKCAAEKSMKISNCLTHGETKFHAGVCIKCRLAKSITLRECDKHGSVKHRGDKCVRCSYEASVVLRECKIHGETKHRGLNCMKCSAEKGRLKRNERIIATSTHPLA